MKKRVYALILVITMLSALFTGCGNKNGENTAPTNAPATGTDNPDKGSTEKKVYTSTFKDLDGNPVEVKTGVQFPLEKEVTITVWWPCGWNFVGELSSLDQSEVFKYIKEQTNVNVEFIHPAAGTELESYSLLYAQDSMPDVIYSDRGTYEYASGPEAAVVDGYFLDLTQLIADYAPNYSALLASNEEIAKNTKNDSGQLLSFYHVYAEGGKACNAGPSIRADILEQLGHKVTDLVTYDDWHTILTEIKEAGLAEVPLFIPSTAVMEMNELIAGFGTAQDFITVDGTVKYGPLEAGYGEFIAMMQQWYKEGLIDSDFAINARDPEEADVISNKYAAWWSYCSWNGTNKWGSYNISDDFNLVGTYLPVKNAGEKAHYRTADTIVNMTNFHISADCKNPEIAAAWLDLFYNKDISLIANYGVGDAHVKNADGSYSWSDKINKASDYSAARGNYATPVALYEYYRRVSDGWSQAQKDSQANWLASSDYDYVISKYVSMSAEENENFAAIMGDIKTFVEEETAKMIAGTSSYNFESFCEKIRSMNIDQAVSIKQGAVDRYNNR